MTHYVEALPPGEDKCAWCHFGFKYLPDYAVVCQAIDLPLICRVCMDMFMARAGMRYSIEPAATGPYLDIVLTRHIDGQDGSRRVFSTPTQLQRALWQELVNARPLDMASGERTEHTDWIERKYREFMDQETERVLLADFTRFDKPKPKRRTRVQVMQDRAVQLATDFEAGRIDLDTYCARLTEL